MDEYPLNLFAMDFYPTAGTCALKPTWRTVARTINFLDAALNAKSWLPKTILAIAQGRTRSSKALGHVISEAAQLIDVDKSVRGLTKTRIKALAEAGATVHSAAASSGHITLEEIEHYAREANRRAIIRGPEQTKKAVTH